MIVYKITNLINGKIYIGQTINSIEKRFYYHCYDNRSNSAIHKAIKKYGKQNFIIEEIDKAACRFGLNYKERFWILTLNSLDKSVGYNLKSGGDCGGSPNKEIRQKIGDSNRGRVTPQIVKDKISKSLKNRIFTQEHKDRISSALRGVKKNYTIKLSDERKQALATSRRGIQLTEEEKLSISNAKNKTYNQRGKSKYKYVYYEKHAKSWRARIQKVGKRKDLGNFKSEELAAKTADIYIISEYGQDNYVNFPDLIEFHKTVPINFYKNK